MKSVNRLRTASAMIGASFVLLPALAGAQTMLKWAHIYETSEAYHTCAVAANELLDVATEGRYGIEVFPASSLGREVDINEGAGLGSVDIIYTAQLFAGRSYGPIALGGAPDDQWCRQLSFASRAFFYSCWKPDEHLRYHRTYL